MVKGSPTTLRDGQYLGDGKTNSDHHFIGQRNTNSADGVCARGATERINLRAKAATELILGSRDQFVGIQGYAGVGKTTQFTAVLKALDTLPAAQRPEVIGLAPTHRAVGEMAAVGVKSQTLHAF